MGRSGRILSSDAWSHSITWGQGEYVLKHVKVLGGRSWNLPWVVGVGIQQGLFGR
jgi:hypothetical protein